MKLLKIWAKLYGKIMMILLNVVRIPRENYVETSEWTQLTVLALEFLDSPYTIIIKMGILHALYNSISFGKCDPFMMIMRAFSQLQNGVCELLFVLRQNITYPYNHLISIIRIMPIKNIFVYIVSSSIVNRI